MGEVVLFPGTDPRILEEPQVDVTKVLKAALRCRYSEVVVLGMRANSNGSFDIAYHASMDDLPLTTWAVSRLQHHLSGLDDEDDEIPEGGTDDDGC